MGDGQNAERRSQPRTEMGLDVMCFAGRKEGTALLENLSTVGVLLESATIRPTVVASVTNPIQGEVEEEIDALSTGVVRLTLDGFAVEFHVDDSGIHHITTAHGDICRRAGTRVRGLPASFVDTPDRRKVQ